MSRNDTEGTGSSIRTGSAIRTVLGLVAAMVVAMSLSAVITLAGH